MSQEPRTEKRAAQPYAGIRTSVTMDGLAEAGDGAFPELFGWLAANGVAPDGPPFIRYLVIDMEGELEIEFGVPVGAQVAESGRIQPGVLPEGSYAVLPYAGSYDGLFAAHTAVQDWAREHGITIDSEETDKALAWRCRLEQYLTDPSSEPDPDKWLTDIAYLTVPGVGGKRG
jgi:effector-binding domain-containing protein